MRISNKDFAVLLNRILLHSSCSACQDRKCHDRAWGIEYACNNTIPGLKVEFNDAEKFEVKGGKTNAE